MHKQLLNWLTGFLRSKRLLFMVAMLIVTIAILGWLVYRQRDLLLQHEWKINPTLIAVSFVLYSVSLIIVVFVWSRLINSLGEQIRFWSHLRYFCISNLAKRLPGTIWYVPWRIKMYRGMGVSLQQISIASGMEWAIMIISGIITSSIFAFPVISKYPAGMVAGLLLLGLSLSILHPRILKKIGSWLKADIAAIPATKIIVWVGFYIGFWIVSGALLFVIGNILFPIPVDRIGYVIGAWTLTGLLGFSMVLLPSNLGITEISLSLLLSVILPSPIAVIIAISSRILLTFFDFLWAAAMFFLEWREQRTITPL